MSSISEVGDMWGVFDQEISQMPDGVRDMKSEMLADIIAHLQII